MFLSFCCRYARPSSRSSAVGMSSSVSPSCTIAKATSGWMPTMTVGAPRRRIMCEISSRVREANESMTSIAVTSTMTPVDRWRTTCWTSAVRSSRRSASDNAAWMVAMRTPPCLRMGTCTQPLPPFPRTLLRVDDLVTQQPLGLLDAALQVADGVHLAQIHADCNKGLRDFGRQARYDHRGAEQTRGFHRLHQVIGHRDVHRGHAGDVDDDDLGAVGANGPPELFGQLPRALRIDDADDRQDEQPLAHLQHRRRQLADRFLLLADDALALLHETDRHGIGDAVGRGLIGVQDAVELFKVGLVLGEQ